MRKKLLLFFKLLSTLGMIGLFSVFVFAQGYQPGQGETGPEFTLRLIGWISITGAGITYIALNVYNAIRGKDYEQLKEALANYKELAESRKAQIAERDRIAAELRAEKIRLETENERLAEKILRQ